jgi:hypothetical protein
MEIVEWMILSTLGFESIIADKNSVGESLLTPQRCEHFRLRDKIFGVLPAALFLTRSPACSQY